MNDTNKRMAAALLLLFFFASRSDGIAQEVVAEAHKTPAALADVGLVEQYQREISPESLAANLHFIASDLFEGRATGSRGQRLAALFLASQYKQMGLMPVASASGNRFSLSAFFQPFSLYRVTPRETQLQISRKGKKLSETLFSADRFDDLAYLSRGGAGNVRSDVVFAGYGIGDDSLGFNEIDALGAKEISIEGKWVMVMADEPMSVDGKSLLPTPERSLSRWTTGYVEKLMAIAGVGKPAGVLVVTDLTPRNKLPFAEAAEAASQRARNTGGLAYHDPSDIIPVFSISAKLANLILGPTGRTIEGLQRGIDKTLKPNVFEVSDVVIQSKATRHQKLETENVLAMIEGSDPELKDEVVVVSAHYDHLGTDPNLTGDQIFNGAADDGSGTVATLEIARAFILAKKNGHGPRRSILFANFTGEEAGLFGSLFYTNVDPKIPHARTVANINMDGVGGIDLGNPTGRSDYVYITGREGLSEELVELNRSINALAGSPLKLADGGPMGFSSDDRSFADQFVPFIYFSTGRTEHYHTVKDSPDTIDYAHMAQVVRLVLANVWQVANQDARIAGIDRETLEDSGYSCLPCGLACDRKMYDKPGNCPFCGHSLIKRYIRREK